MENGTIFWSLRKAYRISLPNPKTTDCCHYGSTGKDAEVDPVYRDEKIVESFGGFLAEAEIASDHGYDATKIASGNSSGAITNIGPAVIGMVRRAIPNLIAFDICGVQPMTGPTGQVFALRAVYGKDPLASGAKEAFHPMFSPDSMYSGQGAAPSNGFTELASGTAIADGAIVFHDFVETGRVFLQNVSGSPVTVTGSTADALDAAVIAEQEKVLWLKFLTVWLPV